MRLPVDMGEPGGGGEDGTGLVLDNVFYNGNLDDIVKDNPEIALLRDGTLDQSQYWFNIDGFDSVLWGNPELNPTNFGKVTSATNSIMRFFTFVTKVNF